MGGFRRLGSVALIVALMEALGPAASTKQAGRQGQSSYRLPKRPVQSVKSPLPPPFAATVEPYLYSIGEPRVDLYLATLRIGTTPLSVVDIGLGGDAIERTVAYTRRLPGTRAPLHTHDYSGASCIIKGQMTLFTNDTIQVRSPHLR